MNIEKTGKTCIEKKYKGFEKPVDKIKRWKRNIRFIFQRVKYGYCDSDVWSIDYWFLMVMPGMLKQLKDTTHSYPDFCGNTSHALFGTGKSDDVDNAGMKKWDDILSEMIFLLNESNEDTCTKKNKYEEDYHKAYQEFREKYGKHGQKLRTEDEIAREKQEGLYRLYHPGDVPEYKEIEDRYFEESRKLDQYRDECKDRAIDMFKEWFWDLWD
ncbi:hypothetical protein SAMN05216349_10890 [Oribacterium sp. KHPX15]|jgi:hypothetical protein|uniref:hypothetical protein n=1 Tax=Oribacterium sp. KHPX15 TaxID=1855342 RepID=UPI0008979BA4|nr:hypothetical protein [Oribacterium sp. KHPX15]SEA28278.1 hypothetical protein SAMN05216349_10890 [Oribacterium sp. KHPX15]